MRSGGHCRFLLPDPVLPHGYPQFRQLGVGTDTTTAGARSCPGLHCSNHLLLALHAVCFLREITDMPTKGSMLKRGRVYRTRDLSRWTANPARLARRLVGEGKLRPLARGLFVHAKEGRFGEVPPTDEAIMRAFLGGPFILTGPEQWNALGLGTSAALLPSSSTTRSVPASSDSGAAASSCDGCRFRGSDRRSGSWSTSFSTRRRQPPIAANSPLPSPAR